MQILTSLKKELAEKASPKKALASAWFFKTGKGQYGEGDKFLGLTVPEQRAIGKRYQHLSLTDIERLLESRYHEHRFTALEILVMQFEKADDLGRGRIFHFYLAHTDCINNWDLVDTSCSYIVGQYLVENNRSILYTLVKSKNIWERRIAIVSTLAFIARNDFADTIKLSELLLGDTHDLIHKAVGWMLREVGKRDSKVLEDFLRKFCRIMPRTMLRYSIEKFSQEKRKKYLSGLA